MPQKRIGDEPPAELWHLCANAADFQEYVLQADQEAWRFIMPLGSR